MLDRGYDMSLVRVLEIDMIKEIDIVWYLRMLGYIPVRTTYKIAWYFAMWRDEREPSLAVYYRKSPQDWYDYGEGVGGSIIDLVMRMHCISYVRTVRYLRKLLRLYE